MAVPGQGEPQPSTDLATQAVAGILGSAAFAKASSLRTLLTYLWEHRDEAISEYAIATEALGRPPDFDPRIDATVRVVIARLRQRLKEYYDSEGASCPLRISIPLGGHQLALEFLEPEILPQSSIEPPPSARQHGRWTFIPLGAAAVAIGIALGFSLPRESQGRPSMPRFWAGFLLGGKPTSVHVPTPVFVLWANSPVRMRDVRINEPSQLMESAEIAALSVRLGKPQFSQSYTLGPDTFAAVKLAQFLEARGVHVDVSGANSLSMDSSLDRNLVLPGTSWSSPAVHAVSEAANYQIGVENTDIVKNRAPRPGELPEYRTKRISPSRSIHYGVIVHRTTSSGTRQLALVGTHTDVLVSFLTAPDSLSSLDRAIEKAGRPPHFEVLVEAETQADTALRAKLVALRPLPLSH